MKRGALIVFVVIFEIIAAPTAFVLIIIAGICTRCAEGLGRIDDALTDRIIK